MTGGWHLGCLGPFDLETTAADPLEARIVTATVGKVGGGEKKSIRNWLLNPGVPIPDEAAAIHGVTTERAQADGMDAREGVEQIVAALAYVVDLGVPVVGHNMAYDFTTLACECDRHGLKPLADRITEPLRVIDSFVIDKHVDRYRPGKRTLAAACEEYRVTLDGAHDSEHDAVAAARVVYRMGQRAQMDPAALRALYADRRYPDRIAAGWRQLGRLSLAELHDQQVGWYREQAEGLAAHWRRCAQELLVEASRDDTTDERREIAAQEVAELDAKVASISIEWPLRTLPVTEGATA